MMSAAATGFDKNKPDAFYRFFLKYGTDFVTQVDMGGSLYYYSSIHKSFGSSSEKVTVDASLEYNGLFQAKATADIDWKKVGKTWVENRQMRLVVNGGNVNFPTTADATFGTNMHDEYNKWINAVDTNPSPMGFKLQSVAKLFSGKVADSISEARHYFIRSEIFIQLERKSATLSINGYPIDTSNYQSIAHARSNSPSFLFSYLAIVLDRETGLVVNSTSVRGEPGTEFYQHQTSPKRSQIPPSLAKYEGNSRYLLIFMWYGEEYAYNRTNHINLAPEPPLRTMLISAGAGSILQGWKDIVGVPRDYNKHNFSVYILVGTFGLQGQGIETIAKTSLTAQPASAKMTLAFTPKMSGGKVLFTASTL
jgi:hypothetical protein